MIILASITIFGNNPKILGKVDDSHRIINALLSTKLRS